MSGQRYYKGWPGPGPGGSQVLTMSQVRGNKLMDSIGYRLYDTARVKAGVAIPTNEFELFAIAVGQQTAGINFATQYAKTSMDTNLRTGGQIPKDHFFRVESLQCKVVISGATDTTYGASGPGTELPTNPAEAAAVASVNLQDSIAEALTLTFRVSNKDYESGTADLFPSAYGISGFAGGGSETNYESVSNNGFGRPYRFPVPRDLDSLRDLRVLGQFAYGITPTRNFRIKLILEGLLWRPIQ